MERGAGNSFTVGEDQVTASCSLIKFCLMLPNGFVYNCIDELRYIKIIRRGVCSWLIYSIFLILR